MFQDELQLRAHDGDQSAFRDIYSRYSREVYAVSHTALGSADSARAVVKQVFLQLYRELMRTEADLDLPARLSALTNEEIRITRIASGDLDPNALLVQYAIASAPAAPAADTMDRIRAHMQQAAAAEAPVEEEVSAPQQETFSDSFERSTSIEDTFAEAFEASFASEAPAEEPSEKTPAADMSAEAAQPASTAQSDEEKAPAARRKSRKGAIIAGIILVILLLLFIWLLAGILMDLEILPFVDLGYSLFNEHVFEFFRLN